MHRAIGIGTYSVHGDLSAVLRLAWRKYYRLIDTAPNYRHGVAQTEIANAIRSAMADGELDSAHELTISTKVGFGDGTAINALVDRGLLRSEDVVGNHTLAPSFIEYQASRNAHELRHPANILFLHNPEIQVNRVGGVGRLARHLAVAFEALEAACEAGHARAYGVATWSSFELDQDRPMMSVSELLRLARQVAGSDHRFRAIQMPISLVRIEAVAAALSEQRGPLVEALDGGLSVFASSPLHGGRMPFPLDDEIMSHFEPGVTGAQACLLFTLSAPAVTSVLTSPSTPDQLADALGASTKAPLAFDKLREIVRLIA